MRGRRLGSVQSLRRRRVRVSASERPERAPRVFGMRAAGAAECRERRGGAPVPPRLLRRVRRHGSGTAARFRVPMPKVRAAAAALVGVRDGPRGRDAKRRATLRVRLRRTGGGAGEVQGVDRERTVRVLSGDVCGEQTRGVGRLLRRDGRRGGGPRGLSPGDGVRHALHRQGSAAEVRDGPGRVHEGGDHTSKVLTRFRVGSDAKVPSP
mmetsp:Transcript_8265/g.36558  ORF Transcript_8265/g.36558 Transcript_8265/m.36558 type:complete len:209 (+) Transcript_8265:767-1393(+)